MADCKPDRIVRRHGGEIWTCKCGTVGVTYAGVTVRYSSKDFRKLSKLMRLAEKELWRDAQPAAEPSGEPSSGPPGDPSANGGGELIH
jgi:hypothetical protein